MNPHELVWVKSQFERVHCLAAESMAIEAVRLLILASHQEGLTRVTVTVAEEVATYLNNKKRRELSKLEDDTGIIVQIFGREDATPEFLSIECHDANGRELKFQPV